MKQLNNLISTYYLDERANMHISRMRSNENSHWIGETTVGAVIWQCNILYTFFDGTMISYQEILKTPSGLKWKENHWQIISYQCKTVLRSLIVRWLDEKLPNRWMGRASWNKAFWHVETLFVQGRNLVPTCYWLAGFVYFPPTNSRPAWYKNSTLDE